MMKRNNEGVPLRMMQRWTRPPMSCQLCRSKKLRCDRTEPCSNCALRKVECVYAGKAPAKKDDRPKDSSSQAVEVPIVRGPQASSSGSTDELLARIRQLEQAVFCKNAQASQAAVDTTSDHPSSANTTVNSEASLNNYAMECLPSVQSPNTTDTPFSSVLSAHSPIAQTNIDQVQDPSLLSKHLPPKIHAMELFKHLCATTQLTFGILHIPSTRSMLVQTYQKLMEGEHPDMPTFFLLFSIFAGATLCSSPQLLQAMDSTPERCQAMFEKFSGLALSIIENDTNPLPPSTKALEGIVSLTQLFAKADGFTEKVHMLRARAIFMAHSMQIHRLDTTRNREQRRMQGFNPVEIEMQRRIWWHMVASDWLLSFSGGPQEGTCLFDPKHMKVNLPRNIDDELIAAAGEQYDFPLCVATSATAFIWKIKLAELCREATDKVPFITCEPREIDYNAVLEMDAKFRKLMDDMPPFFKLDPPSMQQSVEVCRERPYIAFHRVLLHLGVYTRICRLHRPFLLAGYHDAKYAFSRSSCVTAAQKMLEMRRSMDDVAEMGGLIPWCFWTVMQHVFMAAITLATDVSLDPSSPYVSVRKAEVFAACRMLEKSQQESPIARDAIQRGIQTLVTMMHRRCPIMATKKDTAFPLTEDPLDSTEMLTLNPPVSNTQTSTEMSTDGSFVQPMGAIDAATAHANLNTQAVEMFGEFGEQDWDSLWSEFFNVSSDWDARKWDHLMEGIDINLGPTLS